MPESPLGSVLRLSQYVSVQHGNNEWSFLLLLFAPMHLHFLHVFVLGCFMALAKSFITYLILSICSGCPETLKAFKPHVQS